MRDEAPAQSARSNPSRLERSPLVYIHDRGREGCPLPALRTVRAVFPHTALQSVVSTSRVSRTQMSCMKASNPAEAKKGWTATILQDGPTTLFDAVASADTIRPIQSEASTRVAVRASAPCPALAGTIGALCACFWSIPYPPSCPPSLGAALLSALFTNPHRCSTTRALTPAAPRQHDRSLRSTRLPSGHPIPNHVVRPDSHVPITSCVRPVLSNQASPGMRKLAATHRRIGFVYLQAAHSPPTALHPASRRRSCLRLHVW